MAPTGSTTQQVVEGLGRIEARLDGMREDIQEIKNDVKELHGCATETDKRVTLLEKNGHNLRDALAESIADRKELFTATREMKLNWTKLVTVVTITMAVLTIFGSKIGELGAALLRAITVP